MAVPAEKSYWNKVYAEGRYVRGEIPQDASPCAHASLERLRSALDGQQAAAALDKGHDKDEKQVVILEWGCGNGRDARFFAKNGLRVVRTDMADVAIAQLYAAHATNPNLVFVTADFTAATSDPYELVSHHFSRDGVAEPEQTPTQDSKFVIGAIYSRFTVYSIREDAAARAFAWAFEHINPGGLLIIETRSVRDPLCGVGTLVEGERNAWTEDHYRRFTVASELEVQLKEIGFVIDELLENTGFAPYKDEDPVLIRMFARRPS